MSGHFQTRGGRRLAFDRLDGGGALPGVVFIHGFRSDRNGTKALDLEEWCRETGRGMLRFDLAGHGESDGAVEDFGITDWLDDAREIIDAQAPGPQVLVGSSLGGWLALLLAREDPRRWAGLVTIAAAPDFTRRMQQEMGEEERAALAEQGRITRPSAYGEDYVFSRRLFEQGEDNRIFDAPLLLTMPVRMLQGKADQEVPPSEATALRDHAEGPDIELTIVEDADHRFSQPEHLRMIRAAIEDVSIR